MELQRYKGRVYWGTGQAFLHEKGQLMGLCIDVFNNLNMSENMYIFKCHSSQAQNDKLNFTLASQFNKSVSYKIAH